jgi:2'-hydroxyisoflavone reductase
LKILFIGGSRFMGYFAAEHALTRGHEVTLFNRGKSAPDAFPQAEKILGDRDTDVELLRGRQWDAVIDTSGYVPRVVRKSAELLADAVRQYLFISSVSIYSEPYTAGLDENAPVETLEDPTTEDVMPHYGGLKVLCERVVQEVLSDRALIVRPDVIVGPRDPTGRFDYWVRRIARGGEVVAPATPDRPVQFIDARDLGEWLIRLVEARTMGVYNAVGPDKPLTMGNFLDTCKSVSESNAQITWVDEKFLLERNVAPWQDLPLWLSEESKLGHTISNQRALAAGLTIRPLAETVRDTLNWMNADMPAALERQRNTLSAEREQTILQEWHTK